MQSAKSMRARAQRAASYRSVYIERELHVDGQTRLAERAHLLYICGDVRRARSVAVDDSAVARILIGIPRNNQCAHTSEEKNQHALHLAYNFALATPDLQRL